MEVGRFSPVMILPKLNHYPTNYRQAFACSILSVRHFPMPYGYGFIHQLVERVSGLHVPHK